MATACSYTIGWLCSLRPPASRQELQRTYRDFEAELHKLGIDSFEAALATTIPGHFRRA